MLYEINLAAMPGITDIYSVRRRTVWQIVDPDTLLIFAAEGSCRIMLDNENYLLSEGSLFIVPARHYYVRRPVNNELCTLYYAHIRLAGEPSAMNETEAAQRIAERKLAHTRSVIAGERQEADCHLHIVNVLTDLSDRKDEMLALYEDAMSANLRNHIDSMTVEAVLMTRLLLAAAEKSTVSLSAPPTNSSDPQQEPYRKLNKVISYIRQHSKEDISLSDLCLVSNFSKQHLIRVFRSEFGMTPKAYILSYKINCAKEMFYCNPHLSVKEVADEMGFEDQHYFSRLFAKVSGLTPSEFKTHLLTFDPSKQ